MSPKEGQPSDVLSWCWPGPPTAQVAEVDLLQVRPDSSEPGLSGIQSGRDPQVLTGAQGLSRTPIPPFPSQIKFQWETERRKALGGGLGQHLLVSCCRLLLGAPAP